MTDLKASCCLICGHSSPRGLTVLHKHICPECEQDLLGTTVDEPAYDYVVSRLRELWDEVELEQHAI